MTLISFNMIDKIILFMIFYGVVCSPTNVVDSSVSEDEAADDKNSTKLTSRCYFPAEFQGEFLMQVMDDYSRRSNHAGEPIQYSQVNITYDAIPVWGYCYKRVGSNVLLIDRYGDQNSACIRCFQLKRRARNIIEVFSEGLNKCYTNEDLALESCSKLNSTSILYRTQEIGGQELRYEFCPFAGNYHFKYNINDGSEEKTECSSFTSDLDNCPDGSMFHLQFKRCSFENHDITFSCLGSWPGGPNGSRYIALRDNQKEAGNQPQYRCGLYHTDNKRGKTYLAFGSDSSCTNNLINSTFGYETLVLTRSINRKKIPEYVSSHLSSFPKWAQGEWEQTIISNGTMTYNDLNGYHSFTFVAVDSYDGGMTYGVYSKDHCEQEAYVCLMMRQRSENVLEFKIGTISSPVYSRHLCEEPNLDQSHWMTQARLERVVESPCPITGRYSGRIPDLPGTCAALSSNCITKEIMYYRVTDCDTGELLEERTYLCLGQWEENGVMYTYTMRNDTNTNECFVGLIINDEEIYIKEAGEHCLRNINPRTEGMRLSKIGHCYADSSSSDPSPLRPLVPHNPVMRLSSTPRSDISMDTTKTPSRGAPSTASKIKIHRFHTILITTLICIGIIKTIHE